MDGFEPCHGYRTTRRKQGHPEVLLRSAAMGPTGIGRGPLEDRGNRPWNPSAPSELSLSGYHMNLRRDPRAVIPLAYGEYADGQQYQFDLDAKRSSILKPSRCSPPPSMRLGTCSANPEASVFGPPMPVSCAK